jgi:X-Pro dipeptidyl-peptidase
VSAAGSKNVGDGIQTLTTEDCWGETSALDNPCYRQTVTRTVTADRERVTKGILDARNRNSLTTHSSCPSWAARPR